MLSRVHAHACVLSCLLLLGGAFADTLVVDDFISTVSENKLGFESTDDGTMASFVRGGGRLQISCVEADAYFRSSLAWNHCHDMSLYTALEVRVFAQRGQRITLMLREGNHDCVEPLIWPEYGEERMVSLHHYVDGEEFNGDEEGQLAIIPLDHFQGLDISRLADVFVNGIHTQGKPEAGESTQIQLGQIAFTNEAQLPNYSPKQAARFVTNCKPGTFAFTFDGPHSVDNIRQIMNKIEAYDGKATFFLTNFEYDEGLIDVVKEVYERGHQVGSHTYTHPSLVRFDDDENFLREEFRKTNEMIMRVVGEEPTYFRPPYGHVNQDILELMAEEGVQYSVHWNLDSQDYLFESTDPERVKTNVLDKLAKMDAESYGGLVLFHDEYIASANAVDSVLELASSKGYRFVRMDECIADI